MSAIQLYLLEFDNNRSEATRIAQKTSASLQSKDVKLVQLIESLGEYLTHEDPKVRDRTMSYLSEVLAATPSKVLSLQQRDLLCDFLISRVVAEGEGVGYGAQALLSIERLGKWDQSRAAKIMKALLQHTYPLMQYTQQSQRYPILLLIDLLMSKYRAAIENLHAETKEFLPRFINYFDGEKDPRNLMIVFSVLAVVMTEWDISQNAADLFDAAFNYFPITFRPPPDNRYGITAQDLKERLRICISANSGFAPYAFPALLDKLDSTSLNTKRDVLQALLSISANYGPKVMGLYSVTLWDALKFEILQVQEEDLAETSLQVLAEIAKQLSRGPPDGLVSYLKPIVKECNEHLEDAPTKQSQAATQILHAVASASPEACSCIMSGTFPHIFVLYRSSNQSSKRRSLVEVLSQLTAADIDNFGTWRQIPKSREGEERYSGQNGIIRSLENPLHSFGDQVLDTLTTALVTVPIKEVSYRLVLVNALLQMAKVRELLGDTGITRIIELLNNIVISEEPYGKDEMKPAAIDALVQIAHQKPQLVIDISFPAFFSKLPDDDVNSSEKFVSILEAFAKLSSEEKIFSTIIVRLKNKLNTVIQSGATKAYIGAIISALLFAFNHCTADIKTNSQSSAYWTDLVVPLICKIYSELDEGRQDDIIFGLTGKLANSVLRDQTADFQTLVTSEIFTAASGQPLENMAPFNVDVSTKDARSLIIAASLVAAIRKEVPLPHRLPTLIESLANISRNNQLSIGTKAAALQLLQLLVNKFLSVPDVKPVLEVFFHGPEHLLAPESLNRESIQIVFSILKALILRNAQMWTEIVPTLLEALSDPVNGRCVAHGFSTLLQPDDILTKDNHCRIYPLHKQKACAVLVPHIADGYRASPQYVRENYLVALSGILRWLSYAIIEPQVSSMSPLLLQTLSVPGEYDIKAGTIGTLNAILLENPKLLEEHVSSLVTRLLDLAGSMGNPPEVRSRALQCLALVCAKFRREVVLPYRKQVVKRLTGALDDRKRTVRADAVKCRAKWIDLDEPSLDQD